MFPVIFVKLRSVLCNSPLQFLALNNTADRPPWSKTMPGVPGALPPGSIPDHYKLPDEQELPLQKKDGEGMSASMRTGLVGAMMDNCKLI